MNYIEILFSKMNTDILTIKPKESMDILKKQCLITFFLKKDTSKCNDVK